MSAPPTFRGLPLSPGSLLGRRQTEAARKRLKGSPPPKIARKRLVAQPPALAEPPPVPLGCQTPVNSGTMTCSDLAYLLSMDGFVGAIRLRDGLFLGDQLAATDQDFFNANVVLYVLNCSHSEIPNHFDNLTINNNKIQYLSFSWKDLEGEKIFSPRGVTLQRVFDFIEAADAVGASCLVHSKFGKSRAVCVVCAYLMKRYKWSAKKALEFLIAKRPDLTLRRSFVRQILAIENYLSTSLDCEMSTSWDERSPSLSSEELLLRNTFKNSFAGSEGYPQNPPSGPGEMKSCGSRSSSRQITWKNQDQVFEGRGPGVNAPPAAPLPKPSLPSILKSRRSQPRAQSARPTVEPPPGKEATTSSRETAASSRETAGSNKDSNDREPRKEPIPLNKEPTGIGNAKENHTTARPSAPKGMARKSRSNGSVSSSKAAKSSVSSEQRRQAKPVYVSPRAPDSKHKTKSRSLSPAPVPQQPGSSNPLFAKFAVTNRCAEQLPALNLQPTLPPPTVPPWRTTISDLSHSRATHDLFIELPHSSKRSSLQTVKHPAIMPEESRAENERREEAVFLLPRQQRIASNTLEYRHPPPNVRIREISSTRASLPRSDFPLSSAFASTELSRHSTLPPSPLTSRRVLAWEQQNSELCLPPVSTRPSSLSSSRRETSHVSYRDGMAVTQRVSYLRSVDQSLFP
eukprot:Protomagalhaensia_sp_Gyna_25__4205@NODE_381_length_3645_cov_15_393511_g292_i0_p1_GENE_NODE_381_length_3645_cov_15_393511_g292_i0NODE_381_length_3645_cov_15_393511_g292_i0_p1_ORF_typecomplete_len685_score98_04DSPc/PF00782_20/1_5e22Y_phosphatase2/PF03162_13/0_014_NODE_381_length_3645_cov_15_393511_g292_i02052259